MAIRLVRTMADGVTVVRDDGDGREFVLKPGQWEQVQAVIEPHRRQLLERFLEDNRTTGDPRSEMDEQARETMQNATTGEAHEQAEEAER